MSFYRIHKKEGNFFRYRMIAGRIFLSEDDEVKIINGIKCIQGKIILYGIETTPVYLPESVLDLLKPMQQVKMAEIIQNPDSYPSLENSSSKAYQKMKEFLQIAKKIGLVDFKEIWYKDTLYSFIKKEIQDKEMNKDVFALIGKIMYRFDSMTDAFEDLTLIEEHILKNEKNPL